MTDDRWKKIWEAYTGDPMDPNNNTEAGLRRVVELLDGTPSPETHVDGDQHPDDIAVDRFAASMKAKLAKKRSEGRGGWEDKDDCSQLFLSQLLREHVEKGDPVDVGNLAMMLHQRDERITSLLETLQGE